MVARSAKPSSEFAGRPWSLQKHGNGPIQRTEIVVGRHCRFASGRLQTLQWGSLAMEWGRWFKQRQRSNAPGVSWEIRLANKAPKEWPLCERYRLNLLSTRAEAE